MLLNSELLDQLAIKTDAKMIFLVMDGLGGMEVPRRAGASCRWRVRRTLMPWQLGGVWTL